MKNPIIAQAIYRIFGAITVGNALWMLLSSTSWFDFIPGVIDSGQMNQHFVRDVGIAYLLCGVGAFWCVKLGKVFPADTSCTTFDS